MKTLWHQQDIDREERHLVLGSAPRLGTQTVMRHQFKQNIRKTYLQGHDTEKGLAYNVGKDRVG